MIRLPDASERENDEEIDDVATYLGPIVALLFLVVLSVGLLIWATSN